MAPPGTKVLIHETPQKQRMWDFHGKEGWYIFTAMEVPRAPLLQVLVDKDFRPWRGHGGPVVVE